MASKIIPVDGRCSKKGKDVTFQFLSHDGLCELGGSFLWNGSDGTAKPASADGGLSGRFVYAANYRGCKCCGNKYVYQCHHCGKLICYDGLRIEKGACPACGKEVSVAAVSGNSIFASTQPRPAKPTIPKIYVTTSCYDDIAQVLDSMKLPYLPFRGRYDCDILFINCGTSDPIEPDRLRTFVSQGGCVYISDLAASHLVAAFPGKMTYNNDSQPCRLRAVVEDRELREIIGNDIEVYFDMGIWVVIESCGDANVILRAKESFFGVKRRYGNIPLMISFDYGKGKVFYTSFHNHAQASEKETMLLQLLLMKQIGSTSGQTVQQVSELVGLNIAAMRSKFQR